MLTGIILLLHFGNVMQISLMNIDEDERRHSLSLSLYDDAPVKIVIIIFENPS